MHQWNRSPDWPNCTLTPSYQVICPDTISTLLWKAENHCNCSVEKSEPFDAVTNFPSLKEFSPLLASPPSDSVSTEASHSLLHRHQKLFSGVWKEQSSVTVSPLGLSLPLSHPPCPQPVVMEIPVLLCCRNCLTPDLSFVSAAFPPLGNGVHSHLHVLGIQTLYHEPGVIPAFYFVILPYQRDVSKEEQTTF